MPVTVTYQPVFGNIHQGPGFIVWNLLRPLFNMRPIVGPGTPLQISDPATPSAYTTGHAYAVGAMVIDSNNNIEIVTAVAGTGTSGGSAPTWPTAVGATVVDNSGTNQITWQLIGPSFVWAAAAAVIYDQQVRDGNSNIQQCIYTGTTGGTTPSWSTAYGGITQDGSALWMCLGPTVTVGSNEGAVDFKMSAKMSPVKADQYTAPIDFITTEEDGDISGTLLELNPLVMSKIMPNTAYSSGIDPSFPANAQTYQMLTFGGQTRVPRPCVGLFSYRRSFGNPLALSTNPYKWFGGALYAVGPSSDGTLGFTLTKPTGYKVSAKASAVAWRPVGDMVGHFWEQI